MNTFRSLFRCHRWWLLVAVVAVSCGYPSEAQNPEPPRWLLGKGVSHSLRVHQPGERLLLHHRRQERPTLHRHRQVRRQCLPRGIQPDRTASCRWSSMSIESSSRCCAASPPRRKSTHATTSASSPARSTSAPSKAIPRKAKSSPTIPAATSSPTIPRPARPKTSACRKSTSASSASRPTKSAGVCYISTCDDGRPIEKSHFMVLDLKTKKYRDLGDTEHLLRLHRRRQPGPGVSSRARRQDRSLRSGNRQARNARHHRRRPTAAAGLDEGRNRESARRDPQLGSVAGRQDALVRRDVHEPALLVRPDGERGQDSRQDARADPGGRQGDRLPGDVHRPQGQGLDGGHRAGATWRAVVPSRQLHAGGEGGARSWADRPGQPGELKWTDDKGKPLPWHHAVRKEKDGTQTPWVPLGIAASADGSVNILTLAPFTLIRFSPEQLK